MHPQDTLAATRRSLDIEDYIDILRRHKAWVLRPVFAALGVSVVVAFLWPDTYISSAVIRVVPPQVPENLVAANTSGGPPKGQHTPPPPRFLTPPPPPFF